MFPAYNEIPGAEERGVPQRAPGSVLQYWVSVTTLFDVEAGKVFDWLLGFRFPSPVGAVGSGNRKWKARISRRDDSLRGI